MNTKQVNRFVVSFLESTGCHIIEKSPSHVTAKLSPDADRLLTNRPYYWSFVDRTGVQPETMTYTWMFEKAPQPGPDSPSTPLTYLMTPIGRVVREEAYFGSRRLQSLFEAVRHYGKNVTMFEEPPRADRAGPLGSIPYTAWLGANFKVGCECDMKKEQLFGWGISLATGVIDERFFERLREKKLTPRLPTGVHLLPNGLSLRKGMAQLEQALERRLKSSDFAWAEQAEERRQDELRRLRGYYDPMLERASSKTDADNATANASGSGTSVVAIAAASTADHATVLATATPTSTDTDTSMDIDSGNDNVSDSEQQRQALLARFRQREAEIDWQYRPRVTATVMNCGLFHLPGID